MTQLDEWIVTIRDGPEDPSAYIVTKFLSDVSTASLNPHRRVSDAPAAAGAAPRCNVKPND